jgi:hypothetical protein
MVWTFIVILVVLWFIWPGDSDCPLGTRLCSRSFWSPISSWLLGTFGGNISPKIPRAGSWIHILLVIAVIHITLNLLGVVNTSSALAISAGQ